MSLEELSLEQEFYARKVEHKIVVTTSMTVMDYKRKLKFIPFIPQDIKDEIAEALAWRKVAKMHRIGTFNAEYEKAWKRMRNLQQDFYVSNYKELKQP